MDRINKMHQTKKWIGQALTLAGKVEADIRMRNLQEGDRYYNTAETARILGVDTGAANRALQILVKRNIITRRQRCGTFIAGGATAENRPTLQQVHLFVGDTYPQMEGWFDHDDMLALQGELSGVRIQWHSISSDTEEKYVQQIIQEVLKSPFPEGFVLVRASLTLQRMLAHSGLPVALFGHPYASLAELPFVDRDQKEMGNLLGQHVLAQGHRRIALFMRQRVLQGDHLLMNGVREAAGKAGVGVDDFSIHCLAQDEKEIQANVLDVIHDRENLPGIVVRSPKMADVIIKTIKAQGLKPHKDISIAVSDYFGTSTPPYPYIRTQSGTESQAARLGRLIWCVTCGKAIASNNQLVPVQLEIPEGISDEGDELKKTVG